MKPDSTVELDHLLREIRACRLCEGQLPLGPRPVLAASAGVPLATETEEQLAAIFREVLELPADTALGGDADFFGQGLQTTLLEQLRLVQRRIRHGGDLAFALPRQ